MTGAESMRAFLVECMADGIWLEGIEYLPLGASNKLAQAALRAIPDELVDRLITNEVDQ